MKCKFRTASFWLALGTVCLCPAQGVWAQSASVTSPSSGMNKHAGLTGASTGCGYSTEAPAAPIRPQQRSRRAKGESRKPMLLLVSGHDPREDREESDGAAIVGLWKFKFVSKDTPGIPDGTVIDEGYATWHSDGTEIMNSGRPPITGNFCMGVWKKTTRSTYKLNHFGLSWDPNGTLFVGPANIREEVAVGSSGNSYAGAFTIDQFDVNGNRLAHVSGQVSGQRITAD